VVSETDTNLRRKGARRSTGSEPTLAGYPPEQQAYGCLSSGSVSASQHQEYRMIQYVARIETGLNSLGFRNLERLLEGGIHEPSPHCLRHMKLVGLIEGQERGPSSWMAPRLAPNL